MEENKKQAAFVPKTYPLETLAQEWFDEVPQEVRDYSGKVVGYSFGGKSLSKMLQFKYRVGLNNEQIDYWLKQPFFKQDGETAGIWKTRQLFQNALIKHKGEIYIYPPSRREIARKLAKDDAKKQRAEAESAGI